MNSAEDTSEDGPGADSDDDVIDSDDDDDVQTGASGKPYLSLMQSLVESAPHKAKRRKLDHPSAEDRTEQPTPESAVNAAGEDDDENSEDVDRVEEAEEDPADVKPEDLFDYDDEEADAEDPFETHFVDLDQALLLPRLKAIQEDKWRTHRVVAKPMRTLIHTPGVGDPSDSGDSALLPRPVSGISGLKLKKKLSETMGPKHATFDPTEQTIAPLLFNYSDLLYCNRTVAGAESVRRMACLHALNHIFKTRDRVVKNNDRLSRQQPGSEDLELRDQGFTRPKVLIILPTRQSCVKMVEMICNIIEPTQQENRKRFDDGYTDKQSKFSDDKPDDFQDLFAGNDDDMFRLGIKFTRKTIKYFSQFYNSDIIFASPLGLRMAIGSEEEKKMDYDFLSSIEVVIVDQADALLMQNWEHVEYVFEHLNIQPKDAHSCDFSRVRTWYLDDQAKYFRQTVVLSAFNTPELTELLRVHCHNWAGKARLQQECAGVLQQLGVKAKQTFSRFEVPSVAGDPDARFAYFTKAIVPALAKRGAKDAGGTLIFVPSYLDFVRVRNYFANDAAAESITFGTISEYADVPEASRARSHFLTGRHRVLLYTERAHHFRRYQVKGVRRVVFYALPDNPLFYAEIAGGFLQRSEQALLLDPSRGAVRAMFSRYDVMKLERIVGTQRVAKMLNDQGDTFDFV
ncbi:hypothetical protein B0T26DRAFT_636794 [Lasiosphaeria miniovina]|uniref:U3 small nucleolar RNA-associated protein 25 n=1 Tax=Lasiosphaeria miniovina TaxID=1954250 RepID=A0AA40E6B2_9PEZI|nr:uncharacterized protein B0T26DRAFT_636794 [Lasiosphaeria miniovina]KAK0728615.1 hypothetical protein B0T26DRAFT_636794 [Lasiosphaeria miniovina]